MQIDDLSRFSTLSDPRIHPDGIKIAFATSRIDMSEDRYERAIWLWDGTSARSFTSGHGDTSPRWSPDGGRLAFLR
jgi:dipeptidyl aminopeptidase/acylaminoacyl peptidase